MTSNPLMPLDSYSSPFSAQLDELQLLAWLSAGVTHACPDTCVVLGTAEEPVRAGGSVFLSLCLLINK